MRRPGEGENRWTVRSRVKSIAQRRKGERNNEEISESQGAQKSGAKGKEQGRREKSEEGETVLLRGSSKREYEQRK